MRDHFGIPYKNIIYYNGNDPKGPLLVILTTKDQNRLLQLGVVPGDLLTNENI